MCMFNLFFKTIFLQNWGKLLGGVCGNHNVNKYAWENKNNQNVIKKTFKTTPRTFKMNEKLRVLYGDMIKF